VAGAAKGDLAPPLRHRGDLGDEEACASEHHDCDEEKHFATP
jgi:hypothetical protein